MEQRNAAQGALGHGCQDPAVLLPQETGPGAFGHHVVVRNQERIVGTGGLRPLVCHPTDQKVQGLGGREGSLSGGQDALDAGVRRGRGHARWLNQEHSVIVPIRVRSITTANHQDPDVCIREFAVLKQAANLAAQGTSVPTERETEYLRAVKEAGLMVLAEEQLALTHAQGLVDAVPGRKIQVIQADLRLRSIAKLAVPGEMRSKHGYNAKGMQARARSSLIAVIFVLALSSPGFAQRAQENVPAFRLGTIRDFSDLGLNRADLAADLEHQVNERYGELFRLSGDGRDGTVEIVLSSDAQGVIASVSVSGRLGSGNAAVIGLDPQRVSQALASALARAVYPTLGRETPPASLSAIRVVPVSFASDPALRIPIPSSTGIAASPFGRVAIAASVYSYEMDPAFRVIGQPGQLLQQAGATDAGLAFQYSTSGVLWTRGASTGVAVRLGDGFVQSFRTPIAFPYSFTVLPGGRAVLGDVSPSPDGSYGFYATGEAGPERIVLEPPVQTPTPSIATGPLGNLWIYDIIGQAVRIVRPDTGEDIGTITLLGVEVGDAVKSMVPLADGGLLALKQQELVRYDSAGIPLWTLRSVPGIVDSFRQVPAVSVDPTNGYIYLLSGTSNAWIVQLFDSRIAGRELSEAESAWAGITADIQAFRQPTQTYIAAAELAEEEGAIDLAFHWWSEAANRDPRNPMVREGRDRTQLARVLNSARRLAQDALVQLEDFGRTTAQIAYSDAQRMYELALPLSGRDPEIARELERLRAAFEEPDRRPQAPLRFAAITLPEIFPALIRNYAEDGLAEVTLENTSSQPVSGFTVGLSLGQYGAGESTIRVTESIRPGASATFRVPVVLRTEVFGVAEDLPVQAEISLVSEGGWELRRRSQTLLRRATSITWDNSGKLSSFIVPNEETVARFTAGLLAESAAGGDPEGSARESGGGGTLPAIIERAIRLADGLGTYGITYLEDPDSPFTEVLGEPSLVDTVRFPRTTLAYRIGDCDDTSALLASMYEAAGIRTAIVTTPGHVMIAFDTREATELAWLYDGPETAVFQHNGTIWLPVETTVIQKGFWAAWREGSALVDANRGRGQVEFIPLADARQSFPPAGIPAASFNVIAPAPSLVNSSVAESRAGMRAGVYAPQRQELVQQAARSGGRREAIYRNRLGILSAVFGDLTGAERAFNEAISAVPDYLPSYTNLANLSLAAGDAEAALETLARAIAVRPDAPVIHAIRAQAARLEGDERVVQDSLAILRRNDPELFQRVSELVGESGARAGVFQPVPVWDSDEP